MIRYRIFYKDGTDEWGHADSCKFIKARSTRMDVVMVQMYDRTGVGMGYYKGRAKYETKV